MYTKQGMLFYVQVDHLNGEIIGSVIDYLYEAGASNVNVIPSVTKKSRPAHIFFIDTRPDALEAIENIILNELGSSGWHYIDSIHRHVKVDYITKEIVVHTAKGDFPFFAEGKKVYGAEERLRPEHRSCLALKKNIEEIGACTLSLQDSYNILHDILSDESKMDFTL